jgi:hypothetical protein
MPVKVTFWPGGFVKYQPQGYDSETCKEATRPYTDRQVGNMETEEVTDVEVTQTQDVEVQQKANN